ncbi:hypothetical protein M0R45_014452 [Rubus argutus]|uniref:Uncharacterized protein n=1 Tax=Rubus argutus TaxID=59490 RepID=A0AAW1XLP0_RUBAR
MGSSTVPLIFASMKGGDDGFGVEDFETNDAILMSLLEEFQEDDRDDEERLNSVIQSLQAELPIQFQQWTALIVPVPSSPCDDMNWYMDSCEYEMDCPADSGIWETAYDSIMYD